MLTFIADFPLQMMSPERFLIAMGAVVFVSVVGVVTGPQYGNANPLYWQFSDKVLGGLGARLDRPHRKGPDLTLRGFVLCLFGVALAAAVFLLSGGLAAHMPLYGLTETLLLSLTMTAGTVWFALLRLYFALKGRKAGTGEYYAIARSAGVNLAVSDDYGITRTGMALAARRFDKGCVAPVVWYLIAGLPGAMIYAALAALAARFGRDGFCKGFGRVPLALEKLLGFVPSALAGLLISLAGLLTPTGGMTRALVALLHGKNRAPYAEGGLPLTAMAYVLAVNLGGPVQSLDGYTLKRVWVGPPGATAQLSAGHLRRALYLSLMAHLLLVFVFFGGMLWAGHFSA